MALFHSLLAWCVLLAPCVAWPAATHWRLVCASGTPNVSKWSAAVRFSSDGCKSFLYDQLVRSYDNSLFSKCAEFCTTDVFALDGRFCPFGYHKSGEYFITGFITCQKKFCCKYLGASPDLEGGQHGNVSWTSGRNSGLPHAAWLAVELAKPVEVDCIEVRQLRLGACPQMQVESGDGGMYGLWQGWGGERGWVQEEGGMDAMVLRSRISQAPLAGSGAAYEMGLVTPWCEMGALTAALLLVGMAPLLFLELWYEVDFPKNRSAAAPLLSLELEVDFPKKQMIPESLRPCATPYPAGGALCRVRVVCHPRWLLGEGSLADAISALGAGVQVLPREEAEAAFPLAPLERYEAVLRISGGEEAREVGRVMQMLVERRRSQAQASWLLRRLPRFQLVASTRWTFLHFGGSIACGTRRWRSCPARCSFSDETGSLHAD